MLDEIRKTPPPAGEGGVSETSLLGSLDGSDPKPPRSGKQEKLSATAIAGIGGAL
jgi:hypothetical protein